jgi:hypothetical protein
MHSPFILVLRILWLALASRWRFLLTVTNVPLSMKERCIRSCKNGAIVIYCLEIISNDVNVCALRGMYMYVCTAVQHIENRDRCYGFKNVFVEKSGKFFFAFFP